MQINENLLTTLFLILAMIGKETAGVPQESFLFENVVFPVK
jgi:hypothetical protein